MSQLERLTENAGTFAKAYVAAKAELIRAGMPEEQAQETARALALDEALDGARYCPNCGVVAVPGNCCTESEPKAAEEVAHA